MALKSLLKNIYFAYPFHSLNELARKHGTDKSSLHHGYASVYDEYFHSLRYRSIRMLEIGVFNGSSLRMWQDYFRRGEIWAIDIEPECKKHESDRIQILIGDQGDPEFLRELVQRSERPFDIIIDDGSHINELTVTSFRFLFEHLKPGGIYAIEDLHCSHESDPHFSNRRSVVMQLFCELINSVDLNARRDIFDQVNWGQNFENLSKNARDILSVYERWIESIHFHQSQVFIKKRSY